MIIAALIGTYSVGFLVVLAVIYCDDVKSGGTGYADIVLPQTVKTSLLWPIALPVAAVCGIINKVYGR